MATTDNPLSAFMRGFQGAQDRAQKQEQQAIQNQLAEQLRGIQLMNAQQQAAMAPIQQAEALARLAELQKTPEQKQAEAAIGLGNTLALQHAFSSGSAIPANTPLAAPTIQYPAATTISEQSLSDLINSAITPQSSLSLGETAGIPNSTPLDLSGLFATPKVTPSDIRTALPGGRYVTSENARQATIQAAQDLANAKSPSKGTKVVGWSPDFRKVAVQDIGTGDVSIQDIKGLTDQQPGEPNQPGIIPTGSKAGGSIANLTPENARSLVELEFINGKAPSFGMGQSADRNLYLKTRADMLSESGSSPGEIAARQAKFIGDKKALGELTAQEAKIMTFANTAELNLGRALELSNKVDRSGVPVFNRWINGGRVALAGDPDVAAFNAATQLAAGEGAKVLSSSTGSGVTSDAARKEIHDILNTAQTVEQFQAVADVFKNDFNNRGISYKEFKKNLVGALSGNPQTENPVQTTNAPQGVATVPAGMKIQRNTKTGETRLVPISQ